MKRTIIILSLLICVLISFAQTSGGMISRGGSKSKVSQSSSTVKRKPATSARNLRTKRQANTSKTKKRKKEKGEELPDITAEDCYQWGEQAFNSGNYQEAKEWYELAALDNHAESLYSLGFLYYNGLGVTQDRVEAAKWYFEAANNGHTFAAYQLGIMFLTGEDIQEDKEAGFALMKLAADSGQMDAKYIVGVLFEEGTGTTKDMNMARKYYDEAYDYLYDVARKAMKEQNGEQAVLYFECVLRTRQSVQSYDIKEIRTMCSLGYIYFHGMGTVTANNQQAYDWFDKASKAGSYEATFYMGMFYEWGYGVVEKKKKTAKKYYKASGYKYRTDVDNVILSSRYD